MNLKWSKNYKTRKNSRSASQNFKSRPLGGQTLKKSRCRYKVGALHCGRDIVQVIAVLWALAFNNNSVGTTGKV